MTLAEISLGALILAIVVSCVSQMNVGVLALALAWIVGVFIGGMRVEGQHDRAEPGIFSAGAGGAEHLLVPEVYAVEVSDGHQCRRALRKVVDT